MESEASFIPRQTPAPLTPPSLGCPAAPGALIGSGPGASPFDLPGWRSVTREPGNES